MNKVPTTTPVAPTGITTTEVPLAITGTLTDTLIGRNQIVVDQPLYDPTAWIYIDNFVINERTTSGAKLYTWSSDKPLVNCFTQSSGSAPATRIQIVPRSLILPQFSRFGRVSWEVMLKPVKIGDCRVELDIVFSYDKSLGNTLDKKMFLNDSLHFMVDDPDQPIVFTPPMYWIQNMVTTRMGVPDTSATAVKPASYPSVWANIYQRTRYIPNMIQRPTFVMLVYVRPIVSGLSGFSTSNRLANVGFISEPYWLQPTTQQSRISIESAGAPLLFHQLIELYREAGNDRAKREHLDKHFTTIISQAKAAGINLRL